MTRPSIKKLLRYHLLEIPISARFGVQPTTPRNHNMSDTYEIENNAIDGEDEVGSLSRSPS